MVLLPAPGMPIRIRFEGVCVISLAEETLLAVSNLTLANVPVELIFFSPRTSIHRIVFFMATPVKAALRLDQLTCSYLISSPRTAHGLLDDGVGEVELVGLGGGKAGFEGVAEGHEFVDFGYDAVLFGEWGDRHKK
jgi:hypothetical protein